MRRDFKTSPYGKRGGTSMNAGRVLSRYEATAPDGSELRKSTYNDPAPDMVMAIYYHDGRWYAASVLSRASLSAAGMGHYVDGTSPNRAVVPARRLNGR